MQILNSMILPICIKLRERYIQVLNFCNNSMNYTITKNDTREILDSIKRAYYYHKWILINSTMSCILMESTVLYRLN